MFWRLKKVVTCADERGAKWAAGTARDPHHKLTPEEPGDLRPVSDLVERVISDLDRLTQRTLTPPIVPLRWVEKLRTDT
jgi:hypothetical protein